MYPLMQYVGEKKVEELTLHVYYKQGSETSVVYDDGGEGYGYQQGQSTTRRFTVTGTATSLTITQATEGDYQPSFTTYRVLLHGLSFTAAQAAVDGTDATLTEETTETGLLVPALSITSAFTTLSLTGKVS
ncbi:DUF5110 domain-containing protein [Hymenobacter cellulosilyticus]